MCSTSKPFVLHNRISVQMADLYSGIACSIFDACCGQQDRGFQSGANVSG
jgi:hypothetical protein